MENEKKWYYVDYETFSLQNEFFAESAVEAEQMAIDELMACIEVTVEEMED